MNGVFLKFIVNWSVPLLLLFVILFPNWAQASASLGCQSTNKIFNFEYPFIEGDGWMTIAGDFHVSYDGKTAKSGLFNWFKWSDNKISLTVFSLFGRVVHLVAKEEKAATQSQDGGTFYRINSGFVVIDGITFDNELTF